MIKKSNLNKFQLTIFISIIFFGFFLRYLNNFDQIFWQDELYTLFITDPSISFYDFINRHKNIDESPVLYFLILRIYNYLIYSSESIRFSSVIFSILTVLISFKFFRIFFENENSLFCLALISFNIFLIWQSKEARIQSSISFISLLNILFFYKYIIIDNFKNRLILFIINLFSLSIYPFLLMIILSQIIYILINKRIRLKSFFFILLLTFGFYFLINYDYILLKTYKTHLFPLEITFFINFFFRSFFGSIIFGGVNLILFALGLFYLIKDKKTDFVIFNLYLIMVSYLFAIFYTFFKGGGVIAPRYFIFLIPSIIVIITQLLNKKKFIKIKYLYLVLTILNSLLLFDNFKIQKPKLNFLMSNLDESVTRYYFTNEGSHKGFDGKNYEDVYDYYFIKSSILKKKFKRVDKKLIDNYKKIYHICLNYAEMHIGFDRSLQNPSKCDYWIPNFNILEEKEIKNFRITLYEKSQ
mgnify:CR=1 FL=1|tara:strand:- start:368 stop:1777 length:1410 start_codon:yes stop_codon:yes gene_type:complete